MYGDREPIEHQPTEHVAEASQAEQAVDLAAEWDRVQAGDQQPTGGRVWGLPELAEGELWVDIAGASVIAGIPSKSITAYLAQGRPKRNPFPAAHRFLYRLYWPMGVIQAWHHRENALRSDSAE
ncbi:hypothetical protein D5S17_28875 [Pseudonocardiaceae bacterium YIM PH 21723]|nr:hypothetical protein D5S17_28875 [Pseudonocardiaceae bacterium YIM PH 21723]